MISSTTGLEAAIQGAFQQALHEGVFPGAVILVLNQKGERWQAAFGIADTETGEAVREETYFDLASLTKPLCTALAVLRLVQSSRLKLDDRLGDVAADFKATDKADVRVRHLLSHQSGLPAWRPYFETLRQLPPAERRHVLCQLLVHEPLVYRPGTRSHYSDLDFLVLQILVETLSGKRLDRFAAQEIYGPLGIRDLFFNGTDAPPPPQLYAATEKCPWRGRVLKGHVHDDNAYALGGVAGHAGLFGTAAAVADLLTVLLAVAKGAETARALDPGLLREFFRRQPPADWALGFDTPAAAGSSSGQYFSRHSIGHLGFTGTSFWMDLDRGVFVVLLTNRIHPSRANEGLKGFRPLIHDRVMEALGFG